MDRARFIKSNKVFLKAMARFIWDMELEHDGQVAPADAAEMIAKHHFNFLLDITANLQQRPKEEVFRDVTAIVKGAMQ